MNSIKREEISSNVFFNTIEDSKFTTSKISVSFVVPLTKNDASKNALLAGVLTRTTNTYPDFTLLSKKLFDLYGANLAGVIRKSGDNQILTFSISGIDDKYAFKGDNISGDMTELLCDVIFNPKLQNNSFCDDEIAQEKRQLIDRIDSEFNDKRIYANNRATEIMCENEPFGLSPLGTKDSVEKITGEELFTAWQKLLTNSRVEIFFIGASVENSAKESLKEKFSKYNRKATSVNNIVIDEVNSLKEKTETMELSQSKMIMGFRSKVAGTDKMTMRMRVAVAMLGGTAHSKLFNNVREKLSLCYYCSARFNKSKGIMTIESGVEKENIEKAKTAILKELKDLESGNFTDFELEATKLSVCNDFKSIADAEFGLETWYFSQVLSGEIQSIEEACEMVNSVSREEIMEMASKLKLDTIYVLESK